MLRLLPFLPLATGQLIVDTDFLPNVTDHKPVEFKAALDDLPVHETTINHPSGLCEDKKVQQNSGYIKFKGYGGDKSYFFWMFESRSNPKTDPVVVWLTGGPGCSSMMALVNENGPCALNDDGSVKSVNPYSWNSNANVIFLDQPAGTGFSSGSWDHDETGVAEDFYGFMQGFYKELPQYKTAPFFVTGESYAGHYVPAVTHHIWKMNKNPGSNFKIPLKGLAIGNGLTNPEIQYQHYPEMAYDGGKSQGGSLAKGVITNPIAQGIMKAGVIPCKASIAQCNAGNAAACATAFLICNYAETVPYQIMGYNPYDMRIKCEKPPLCYDFSGADAFYNKPEVQKAIGAKGSWSSCNMIVNKLFMGDWMHGFHEHVKDMLDDGMEVMIYAGDVDYICNWLGNKAWVLDLDWKGKAEMNQAKDDDYKVAGKSAGRFRNHKNFSFLQIYQAGHMVPMDQPEAALTMLNQFIQGKLPKEHKQQQQQEQESVWV